MRRSVLRAVVALVAVVLVWPVMLGAQFGHPLKGAWSGQWGPPGQSNRLLLDLHWDGKAITGTINPGPNAAAVKSVAFDYSDPTAWKVTLEAEGRNAAGGSVAIRVDGVLENLGAYARVFRGTWMQDGQKAPFVLTRN